MINNILTIIFLVVTQISYAQKISKNEYAIKTSLSDFRLNGKVEKITSTATDPKGNTTTLPFLENEYYDKVSLEFNSKGFITKRINHLDYRGKLAVYNFIDYSYNSSNLIINQINTVINNGEDPKRIASNKTFEYDAKNRLITFIEKIEGKTSKSSYETVFTYSNKLDKITTKIEGIKISENNLIYNKKGLLVLDEMVSFDGKKGKKSYYIYDKEIPVFAEEVVGNNSTITFFENGNRSYIQSFDKDKKLNYQANFDSKGNIINFKKLSFRNGQPFISDYKVSYDYDSKGNWIKANVTSDNELKFIVTRIIKYY